MRNQSDHTLNAYAEAFTQDVRKNDVQLVETWIQTIKVWIAEDEWTSEDEQRFKELCQEKYSPWKGWG